MTSNQPPYKYFHLIPTDTMYQTPSKGHPRIRRDAKSQLAQAGMIAQKMNPAATHQRRLSTFAPAPSGKPLTMPQQIGIIRKLQAKIVAHLEKRIKEEKDFLGKVTSLEGKVSKKVTDSNKKKKEHNNAKNNNAKRTRLANEYGKINREVEEIIRKDIPTRNKIQEMVKEDFKLQQSIGKFYTRNLQNHLMFGNSDIAVRKRQIAIRKLADRLREGENELYANAMQFIRNTPNARAKFNKLTFPARNNAYKSKLTLPRSSTNTKLYNLPIKTTLPSGQRKSLKNIRVEYRQLKQQQKGMNVSNNRTTPVNAAKKGPNTSRKKGAAAAAKPLNRQAVVNNMLGHEQPFELFS